MERSGLEIIHARDSRHLTLKPTEKIGKKYFYRYLLTQLKSRDIFKEEFSHYFSGFCENSLNYEIILLNAGSKDFLYEPFVFESFYKNKPSVNSVDVFVTEGFFSLFKNGRFLLCRLVDKVKDEELKLFISQAYALDISNIYRIDKPGLEKLKKNASVKKEKRFKKLNPSNPFKYFILFNLIGVSLLSLLLFNEYKEKLISKPLNTPAGIKNRDNPKPRNTELVPSLALLFEYIKENDIKIKNFELKNGKNLITLQHKNKKSLLEFNRRFNNKISDIHSISFGKRDLAYSMEVTLEH